MCNTDTPISSYSHPGPIAPRVSIMCPCPRPPLACCPFASLPESSKLPRCGAMQVPSSVVPLSKVEICMSTCHAAPSSKVADNRWGKSPPRSDDEKDSITLLSSGRQQRPSPSSYRDFPLLSTPHPALHMPRVLETWRESSMTSPTSVALFYPHGVVTCPPSRASEPCISLQRVDMTQCPERSGGSTRVQCRRARARS